MSYTCELNDHAAMSTLTIRAHISVEELAPLLGEVYGAIAGYLDSLGESPAGAPFVIYYNQDMQNLDVEAGFPVERALPGTDEIHSGEIPAGEQASVLHVGPYDRLGEAYEALDAFVKARGLETVGPAYEFYIKGPMDHPAEELETVIVFPLK